MRVAPRSRAAALLAHLAASAVLTAPAAHPVYREIPVHSALSERQWAHVGGAVERGLAYLIRAQAPDGAFPSHLGAQPAVTSLGVMAFLSAGHRPGEGPYGESIDRAINYVLSTQEPSGLLCADHREYPSIRWNYRPHTATYNHAIAGLMLGEAYGQADAETNRRLKTAIERALVWARNMQLRPPRYPEDKGGWRYLHEVDSQKPLSDLSVTGWFVMFYRSARNAEFRVPEEHVDQAAAFVERCYVAESGAFFYGPHPADQQVSRGMTGAGLLVLTVSGRRDADIARGAGTWLLEHPYDRYAATIGAHDRFHYSAYYCSQAMYLLGGKYWEGFYPVLAQTLVTAQRPDGGWDAERQRNSAVFGRCYTTSLAVLALTPPYQLLPIYQR